MKADKILDLLKEDEPKIQSVQDLMGMIAELVQVFTSGKAQSAGNPYMNPVVKKALQMLAHETGTKDWMDVDLGKLIRR